MDPKIEKRFKNVMKSEAFMNILETFGLSEKKVLDVGCAFGEYLANFGMGSVGLTVVDEEVEFGKKNNLDIRFGNVDDSTFHTDERFDVVYANNLFEHLYSPHSFLIKTKDFLKEDGILILGVPCIPKIVSLLHFVKFRGSLATAHINFFTRDTLIKTVERAGWYILECRSYHFKNNFVDQVFNFLYPHFYVIAKVDKDFKYDSKRERELAGYK